MKRLVTYTQLSSALAAALLWALSAAVAHAQERPRAAASKDKSQQVSEPKSQPAKRKRKQKRTQKPPPKTSETMLADKPKTESQPQPTAAAGNPKPRAVVEDDADVRTEGDKAIKAMEFTGLDIEGQLKTPQMLFFLNRLRAEFDRPRLPHRSFMPELEASREHKEL